MTVRTWWGAAGLLVLAALASACGDLCGDEELSSAVSPDGRYVARAFIRNCGATTAYVTRVDLANNRRWFRNETAVYVEEAIRELTPVWPDSRHLVIICDGCGAFPPDRQLDDVIVQYRRSSGERS